jgi:SecA DEAD-like domain
VTIVRAGRNRPAPTVRRLIEIVAAVNALESKYADLTDAELRTLTGTYRERNARGETLDDLMPEAYATVREAARRVLGERAYDVQIMGAAAMHLGNGVPIVWPDGLQPSGRRRGLRWWGWLDLIVLVPVLMFIMAVGGRGWLLRLRFDIGDNSEPRMRWSWMTKVFLEDRDRQLTAELTKIHEDRRDEGIDVGVVHGAGHFPAVVRTLTGALGYHPVSGGEWLIAIDF